MFWFIYVLPAAVSFFLTGVFVFYDWLRKGYTEGDDLGMVAGSFLPVVNWIIMLTMLYALWTVIFSKKQRYFVRKQK